jgi:hypothetical protein
MSFLLKIVQGPQAGAEIALVEGVSLSVGRSDTCDIVLNDASISDKAFELEVTSERVVAILPGGKDIKFEPFHVVTIGTTSLVVGPGEGEWKDIVWPKEEEEPCPEVENSQSDSAPKCNASNKRRGRGVGCFIFLLILLSIGCAAAWLLWTHPKKVRDFTAEVKSHEWVCKVSQWARKTYEAGRKRVVKSPPVEIKKESLETAAKACGFSIVKIDGKVRAIGNFKNRAERLEATARVYAAHPGTDVDFADAESLKSACDELLNLVSEGRIHTRKVEGRKVYLEGVMPSQVSLRRVLESLSADLPKIEGADCSRVTIGAVKSEVAAKSEDDKKDVEPKYAVPRMKAERKAIKSKSTPTPAHPEMPVAGILTVPYPCLVLSDGARAMEGARFGEYVVEKIESDRVTVRGREGIFIWRP